jgi:large subunit ribosomal protein L23
MSAFWDKAKKSKEDKQDKVNSDVSVGEEEKKGKVAEVIKAAKKNSDEKKGKKKAKKKIMTQQEAKVANKVLVSPKVSEAAMNQQAIGKYVFQVVKNSTKREIVQAIEAFYGVDVTKVNTVKYSSRSRSFRGVVGATKGFKKAIVTIKNGQSLDIFKETK